jgi:hypothetical protein
MAIASYSSLSTAATCEHACSVLSSTCTQLTGRDDESRKPGDPSPATPGSTAPKNSGVGTVLPGAVHPGMLRPELCTKSYCGHPIASVGHGSVSSASTLSAPNSASKATRLHVHPIKRQRHSHPTPASSCLLHLRHRHLLCLHHQHLPHLHRCLLC